MIALSDEPSPICEYFASVKQVTYLTLHNFFSGRNHPKYPKEDYLDDVTPPTTPELKRTTHPLSTSKEQDELRKDLKFSQQR